MAQQHLNYGSYDDDPTADTIRDTFGMVENNFDDLYANTVTTHTKTSNLTANMNNVLAGSGFTPAITREPYSISVYNAGVEVQGVIKSWAQNGSNYDITLYVTDSFTNAKIKVIC